MYNRDTVINTYHIEITDTFGGEANYSWKKDFLVRAKDFNDAICKLARKEGAGWRKDWDSGDSCRYNLRGACVCAFVTYLPESAVSSFKGAANITALGDFIFPQDILAA